MNGSPGRKFFGGLICAALIRRTESDRMYFLIQNSMQLCLFIHLSQKRAKTTALLDLGATKNFINMQYAKELHLPIKCLHWPQPVCNVDRTRNKNGDIEHYTDLEMQTSNQRVWLWFFLTNLADQKAILGYPWFAAMQPSGLDRQQPTSTHPLHQTGHGIMNRSMCTYTSWPKKSTKTPTTNLKPSLCYTSYATHHKWKETDLGLKISRISGDTNGRWKDHSSVPVPHSGLQWGSL